MKRVLLLTILFLFSFSLASAIQVNTVELADLGFNGFVVEANLDTVGSAQVLYGKTGALGSKTTLVSSSSEHLLQVDGLAQNTVYFYRVVGKDSQGNSYTSAISLTRTASNSVSTNDFTPSAKTNTKVAYWQKFHDAEWKNKNKAVAYKNSLSGDTKQEHYFLVYGFDGVVQMWQASGDNKYLDEAITLVYNTIGTASKQSDGYQGWDHPSWWYSLWDGFYWRSVASFTRILHESPDLRASNPKYQKAYEDFFEYTKIHEWERRSKHVHHFNRQNTHMSSHWARISMELYVMTGEKKYKDVMDNYNYVGLKKSGANTPAGANLRDQLKLNPKKPHAYVWAQTWSGTKTQDTSHAAAIIGYIVTSYENNQYWNKQDIQRFTSTYNDVIWTTDTGRGDMWEYVDGTGERASHDSWQHEWLMLGRFDQSLQDRIKNNYKPGRNVAAYWGSHAYGIAALNARILGDGRPIYPENPTGIYASK